MGQKNKSDNVFTKIRILKKKQKKTRETLESENEPKSVM